MSSLLDKAAAMTDCSIRNPCNDQTPLFMAGKGGNQEREAQKRFELKGREKDGGPGEKV